MEARKIVNRRIEELRENILHVTQADFAEILGLKGRSNVNNWEQGGIQVKSDDIINIAKRCSVSADWLLGLSDAPNRNSKIQGIHSATGLSQNAIIKLMRIAKGKDSDTFPAIISAIIENSNSEYFLALMAILLDSLTNKTTDDRVSYNIDGEEGCIPKSKFIAELIKSDFIETLPSIAQHYHDIQKGKGLL